MNNATFPHCLLCGSDKIATRRSMTTDEILKCWALHGCHFDVEAIQSLMDEEVIHLFNCNACGFQFFDPRLEANSKFYGALYKQLPTTYYPTDCVDYLRNTRFAVGHDFRTMLDVGCGAGAALDNAKRGGLETYGIEPSATAAAAAARRGHTIFPVPLEKMDTAWEGKFDLITLNQVLEHVPDPVGLIQQCVRLLSSRGAIAITVPSATGVLRLCPWLEHNWPPHHLSHWRIKDFYKLADRVGLQIIKTGANRLYGRELKAVLLENREHCQALQKPYRCLPPILIRVICYIYRLAALQYFFSSQGGSNYCFLGHEKTPPNTEIKQL
jgi:SAM-dependent methyltransferase